MELYLSLFVLAVFIKTSYGDADVRRCNEDPQYLPSTTVRTNERLKKLRKEMKSENLDAYIIPSTDAHGSEYVRVRDKRRQYISGFSGSAGDAIVTTKKSALWTDGRYFLQGDLELDCNWILQKAGIPGVPSKTEWLKKELESGATVGIDPFLMRISTWDIYAKSLKKKNITLKGVTGNLVDKIWSTRPLEDPKTVDVQLVNYTGKSWTDKVTDVQKNIRDVGATAHVVQELDSIAWLLNLRGSEIPYNPVFFAYAIVNLDGVTFFVNDSKIATQDVEKHLMLKTCLKNVGYCITRKPYDAIAEELKELSSKTDAKIWLSPKDSHALRLGVSDDKVYLDYSPIRLMKAMKNEVELKGMKYANLKDSVALSQFFMWAEEQVAKKAVVTELSLEKKMEYFRSEQDLYKGLSFASIVGFGANGAVIHYRASNETNLRVFDNSTLLVDTGSQYLDGSTDVTRTVHFGEPTARQKQAFTRVLMGQIDLATAVFPEGTYGRAVDIFARQALFRNGWNYRHGTGHGIGSYLYIHEGPGRITSGCPAAYEKPLSLGMVFSDEPGYYEDGSFGIRLETAVVVVNATTPNRFNNVDYYKFEPICWFPVQRKLIDKTIMTNDQIKWINWYHQQTEKRLGDELKNQGKTKEYEWLLKHTKPISLNDGTTVGHATTTVKSSFLLFLAAVISFVLVEL